MLNFVDTGGLFDHFEVNRDPFWPRIARLLGGSIVFHLVVVACVVFIPPVREALSVAALFSEAGFVDRAYSRSEIEDGVDVVELTTEKFHYPEGYFAMDQQGVPPAFPAAFTPPPMPRSSSVAQANSSPSPSPSPAANASPLVASETKQPTPSDSKPKVANEDAERAQKDLEKASKETGIELPKEGEINKKPFKDFLVYANDLKKQGKLDINQAFEVVIETELDRDGKLKNPKFSKKAGDVNLADLGGRLVSATNDSGILFYLKKLNEDNPGTKVTFTIKQDNEQVIATVESEAASASSARGLATAFNYMLFAGAKTREGKDEEVYLRNTKVSAEEKKLIFNLTLPRETVVELLKKDIASASSSGSPAP